ncbi:hypothetical protein OO015_07310 [Thermomicrobium sp. 4228-Ro]|uniref:MqnA/MqnD/SBP family protein n=1 Tax=Thermomicrobium sp. 4228-Ro TaxID=2993937 RepID=UPI002248F9BA|nr:MqnA/MqnD/SBP family protein [Thermomicrobium sp. 4228-Ro]MCX2727305.1 hypothetical protein [Thermomicrobium sp. 4228-Ro]
MSRPIVWLDRSLIARLLAPFLEPVATDAGWEIRTRPDLTAAAIRAEPGIALLDTLEALALLPAAFIATDLAVFSQHTSAVALSTPERPDRIDRAAVSVAGCRPASTALARATIEPFFGLRVVEWQQEPGSETSAALRVVEDEAALVRLDEHHHDLGRAWFILTGLPFVSHVLVCPADVAAETRQTFARWAQRLPDELRDRAAEIASDLAAERSLDAGRVLSYITEALNVLTPPARRAIEELLRRSRSALRPPKAEHYRSLSS